MTMDLRFKEDLLAIMDQKNHWAWKFFSRNKISKDQLKIHFGQEYAVYVRDFPVFLGRIYAKNPPLEVRHDLAENIYEEETGGLSRTGPHPALFLKMMKGLGFKAAEFQSIDYLPKSLKYRKWLDQVTLNGNWFEGASVITLFVEGSVKDREELDRKSSRNIEEVISAHPLVKIYGVDSCDMDLVRAHGLVEQGHRKAAWKMVLNAVDSLAKQRKVKSLLGKTLDLWLSYRDGVAAACNFTKS